MNTDEIIDAIQSLQNQNDVLKLSNGVLLATIEDMRREIDGLRKPKKNPNLKGAPPSPLGQIVRGLAVGESYFLEGDDARKQLQNRSQTAKAGRSYAVRPATVDGVFGAKIFRLDDLSPETSA